MNADSSFLGSALCAITPLDLLSKQHLPLNFLSFPLGDVQTRILPAHDEIMSACKLNACVPSLYGCRVNGIPGSVKA